MKKLQIMLLMLSCLIFITGCSQFAYNTIKTPAAIPVGWKPIVLDNTYDFYYRAITSEKHISLADTANAQQLLGVHLNNLITNPGVVNIADTMNRKIIEIEYLWLKKGGGTAVYISTVADRFQDRYSDTLRFAGLDHPNGADFRVFLIGTVDSTHLHYTFYFKDNKHTDDWTAVINGGQLKLMQIIQRHNKSRGSIYDLDESIAHHVTFTRLNNWEIIFNRPNAPNKNTLEYALNTTIYYEPYGKNKFRLFIPFQQNTLTFKNKYVIYKPGCSSRVPFDSNPDE